MALKPPNFNRYGLGARGLAKPRLLYCTSGFPSSVLLLFCQDDRSRDGGQPGRRRQPLLLPVPWGDYHPLAGECARIGAPTALGFCSLGFGSV